jgi:type II secretory pathway predicted ATPase ExeA
MYERHFRFSARPFALTPDPSFLYSSRQYKTALTLLEYGIESQAVFSLLTGEIGSGKTTLVRHLLRQLDGQVTTGLISNCHESFRSILPWVVSAFGIVPSDDSDIALHEAIVDFTVREYARGRRTLLIVDEAQNLPVAVLEELRLLSNMNSERDVVFEVLLVGQPELRETLRCAKLRQFAQRISVDYHLWPLALEDTRAYIRHRLRAAGGDEQSIDTEAIDAIHELTRGVPRLINRVCDMALVYAYAEGRASVGRDVVESVMRDREEAALLPVFGADGTAERVGRSAG